MDWKLGESLRWSKDYRHYEKKHPTELAAVMNNLDTYMKALTAAAALQHVRLIQAGYLHNEPKGVIAIDQSGGEGKLQATRLYTYAYLKEQKLYLITIGNKKEQQNDIEYCKEFVKNLG